MAKNFNVFYYDARAFYFFVLTQSRNGKAEFLFGAGNMWLYPANIIFAALELLSNFIALQDKILSFTINKFEIDLLLCPQEFHFHSIT